MTINKTPEELQAWLSESTEDPIQLALQKEELVNQTKTLTESNAALAQTISEKEAELVTVNEAHEAEMAAKQEEIEAISATVEADKAKLIALESEIEELTAKNAELIAEAHLALAEKVVDMKISCGRTKGEEKEAQMEIYTARTDESLNDTLADLRREVGQAPAQVQKTEAGVIDESYIPPAVSSKAKGENVETEKAPVTSKIKPKTASSDAEAIKNMFTKQLR